MREYQESSCGQIGANPLWKVLPTRFSSYPLSALHLPQYCLGWDLQNCACKWAKGLGTYGGGGGHCSGCLIMSAGHNGAKHRQRKDNHTSLLEQSTRVWDTEFERLTVL